MRPPPLKIADESSRRSGNSGRNKAAATNSPGCAKPPLPAARRGPVIIHTYSPKVIQTSTQDFMELVQRLTGSSDTRLRCKKKTMKSTKVSSSNSSSSKKFKSRLALAHSSASHSSEDHPGGVYKPTRPNLPEEMDEDRSSSSQGLGAMDDLSLSSFKSPLLASGNEHGHRSDDEHINLSVGIAGDSVGGAPSGGGSLGWSSPIPTPNFLLQHDLFKDLPLLSPVFSPAWPHQVGRYAS